jgi:uncharacterized membrane protein
MIFVSLFLQRLVSFVSIVAACQTVPSFLLLLLLLVVLLAWRRSERQSDKHPRDEKKQMNEMKTCRDNEWASFAIFVVMGSTIVHTKTQRRLHTDSTLVFPFHKILRAVRCHVPHIMHICAVA